MKKTSPPPKKRQQGKQISDRKRSWENSTPSTTLVRTKALICLTPGLAWKFIRRRTWFDEERLPMQFLGQAFTYNGEQLTKHFPL